MIVLPPQSYQAWRAGMTFLHIIALCSCLSRLAIRYKTKKLWRDDYLVVFPLIMDFFFVTTLYQGPLFERNSINPNATAEAGVPTPAEIAMQMFWYSVFPTLTIVWLSRMSLSLSLVRAFPRHRLPLVVTYIFGVLYVASVIGMVFGCKIQQPGVAAGPPMCPVPTNAPDGLGPDMLFTFDLLSDIILVAVPLFFLWRVKLPARDRRMVLTAFSTSILTLSTVIVYMVFIFAPFAPDPATFTILQMMGHFEASIGLLACNLLVISTFVYRFLTKKDDGEHSSYAMNPSGGIAVMVKTHRSEDPYRASGGKSTIHTESHRDDGGEDGRVKYINLTPISRSTVTEEKLGSEEDIQGRTRKDDFAL